MEVFAPEDHPSAPLAYAWADTVDDSEKRRFVVVLHTGVVDSPLAAVRAAILQETRERER